MAVIVGGSIGAWDVVGVLRELSVARSTSAYRLAAV